MTCHFERFYNVHIAIAVRAVLEIGSFHRDKVRIFRFEDKFLSWKNSDLCLALGCLYFWSPWSVI
ncbi:hypothetical protein CKA32_003965 [Geitlerinema sp. FC II]|nr:hypothetical protein CKA32_003965 [Geitlerinema sp. FC II]